MAGGGGAEGKLGFGYPVFPGKGKSDVAPWHMWPVRNEIRPRAQWIPHLQSGSTNLHCCDRLDKVAPLGHCSYQIAINCGNLSLLLALFVDVIPVRRGDT